MNHRHLFLTFLQTGKSKFRALAYLVSGEGLLPQRQHLLTVSSHDGRGEGALSASFIRAPIPFIRVLPA